MLKDIMLIILITMTMKNGFELVSESSLKVDILYRISVFNLTLNALSY